MSVVILRATTGEITKKKYSKQYKGIKMAHWKISTQKKSKKKIKKMVIGSYIWKTALTVNGLNAPTKRHRLAGQMKICACMHFHLPHHSA